jgi:hypothetical protein
MSHIADDSSSMRRLPLEYDSDTQWEHDYDNNHEHSQLMRE